MHIATNDIPFTATPTAFAPAVTTAYINIPDHPSAAMTPSAFQVIVRIATNMADQTATTGPAPIPSCTLGNPYYWYHSYRLNLNYTSASCRNKKTYQ